MNVVLALACFLMGLAAALRASRSPRPALAPYPWIVTAAPATCDGLTSCSSTR